MRSLLKLVQAALKRGATEELEAGVGRHHRAGRAGPGGQAGRNALLLL